MKNELNLFEDNRLPKDECFDFNTKTDVNLSLDFGFEGYSFAFAVYTSNPYNEDGEFIEGKSSIYEAYTDKNSSFLGKFDIPAYAKKLYVCPIDAMGVPASIEVDVENGLAGYTYQYEEDADTRSISYTESCVSIGSRRVTINSSNKLYALYNDYSVSSYVPKNSYVNKLYSEVSTNTRLTSNSTLGQLISRIEKTLTPNGTGKKVDNSYLCAESKNTNLRIAHTTTDGQTVEGAHIDLNFLKASGGYHNAMGYYYYKSDATLSAQDIKDLPKFMVFPRSTSGKPSSVRKARLQFFGENYNEVGIDHFPPGYTVGWILVADINSSINSGSSNAVSKLNTGINTVYSRRTCNIYSNREANAYQNFGCITLYDKLSEKIIIGFEDNSFNQDCGDKSYEDILFYVDCDPIAAVYDPERPEVSDGPEEEIIRTQSKTSTLAFEDIWPTGGDYDMNDVVVELTNDITYNNKNRIKRIETTVKAVHNGATLANAFGVVINGTMGDIVVDESSYFTQEESNQFIFFNNIQTAVGETFKLVRTFGADGIDKLTYNESMNPFIAVDYHQGLKPRKEVHLPKNEPTSWINSSLIGQGSDMYFIDIEGNYPFAIELFDVKNWEVVTESNRIGSEDEYPRFDNWVKTFGAQDADWYLKKR